MPLKVSARLRRVVYLFGNVGREVSANAALTSGQFIDRYMIARILQHVHLHQIAGFVQ